jgi:hypothetical protein
VILIRMRQNEDVDVRDLAVELLAELQQMRVYVVAAGFVFVAGLGRRVAIDDDLTPRDGPTKRWRFAGLRQATSVSFGRFFAVAVAIVGVAVLRGNIWIAEPERAISMLGLQILTALASTHGHHVG